MTADQPVADRPDYKKKRGELRIYLGAAPGVGKTFAMLGEAHRRLERGTDLVAAVVETHGRKKTADLIDGHRSGAASLHRVPRQAASPSSTSKLCCGVQPQVVLVDELAHTNTPGSKNPKRWQDVEELLDAGITVISTVNVQHLESLNDVVTQITGIEQQEKVPDEIVRAADQIELVDITPEALRRRLAHGNVYAPERVDAALSNYFRRGNLTALRELALLWLADQVDAALEKYREENQITDTWEARERVVVAVTGGPESETLVRRASRIASRSSAELMVVHVVRGDGLSGVSAPQMGKVRELAISLGATLHTVVGDDVPTALLDFARDENATQLVIGTSRRSRWARIFDEGIGAAVVQQSGKIDVHMVTHGASQPGLGVVANHTPTAPRNVLACRPCRSVRDLRGDRLSPRPVPRDRRRERDLLHRRADRRAARRSGPGCTVRAALRSAAELFPGRPAVHVHHRRTRQRGDGRGAACSSRWPSPRWSTGRPAAPEKPGAHRRRPNCSHCSPDRCCAAPTWTRCWSGCAKPIHSAPSACCGKARASSGAWVPIPASTSTPPTPRSRSATTSSGC